MNRGRPGGQREDDRPPHPLNGGDRARDRGRARPPGPSSRPGMGPASWGPGRPACRREARGDGPRPRRQHLRRLPGPLPQLPGQLPRLGFVAAAVVLRAGGRTVRGERYHRSRADCPPGPLARAPSSRPRACWPARSAGSPASGPRPVDASSQGRPSARGCRSCPGWPQLTVIRSAGSRPNSAAIRGHCRGHPPGAPCRGSPGAGHTRGRAGNGPGPDRLRTGAPRLR